MVCLEFLLSFSFLSHLLNDREVVGLSVQVAVDVFINDFVAIFELLLYVPSEV